MSKAIANDKTASSPIGMSGTKTNGRDDLNSARPLYIPKRNAHIQTRRSGAVIPNRPGIESQPSQLLGSGHPIANLVGQRHFGELDNTYKHDAQASVLRRKWLTRLRFELAFSSEVALSN